MSNKLKIINDPIYGFITLPNERCYEIIEHPYFQRLRRISQMGMSYLVYPGAHHTRFHHALGALFLMQKAVQVLKFKKVAITLEEEEALYYAILLHDIGHGPFSHAMEQSIVEGVNHEELSLLFMKSLNDKFNGTLTLAISIFKNEHPKLFLHQLVASQLDVDRLDYLKRDSFYTGVAEGNINSQRLIDMLNVYNNELVVEEKGIYSVEKFIMARRLMYWQVYLHKTSLVAEQLLLRLLKRAKWLTLNNVEVKCSEALTYFLNKKEAMLNFTDNDLEFFAKLDDIDILAAIKEWIQHHDFVLSTLSIMLLHRDLLKIKIKEKPFNASLFNEKIELIMKQKNISNEEASYFVFQGTITNEAYNYKKHPILLLKKNNKVIDIAKASDQFYIKALSKQLTKHYMCFPKAH